MAANGGGAADRAADRGCQAPRSLGADLGPEVPARAHLSVVIVSVRIHVVAGRCLLSPQVQFFFLFFEAETSLRPISALAARSPG